MNKLLISLSLVLSGLTPALTWSAENGTLVGFTAHYQMMPKQQVLDGLVEAVMRSTVSAQVAGRVTEIQFDVNDNVKKGAVLLRIRDTEYKARLKQAEAANKEAVARHKDAQSEFKRIQDLHKKGAASTSQLDRTRAELQAAEARIRASDAQITEAKEQLENTVVRAPYPGVVTERHIELGEMAAPGTPLMTGLSLEKLRVEVNVPQSFINSVRQFQQAKVIDDQGRAIDTSSMTIFPVADAQRHSFRVRVQLPDNTPELFPGMLVKVAFTVGQEERLMVPESAVIQRSEVSAVYVIDKDGKLSMRQVRLGERHNDQREILAGLSGDERIAMDPVLAGMQLKRQAGEQ